jgi:hypothetical protein
MELIRTASRDKLPRGFSYPVGAEIVSSALHDIPQFSLMEIHFAWKDGFWTSRYNEKLKALGKITVLEVCYENWNGEWRIDVSAVPSEHKQIAGRQLSDALPRFARELAQTPLKPSYFHWQLRYDLAAFTTLVVPCSGNARGQI